MNSLQSFWERSEIPILNGVMFPEGFIEEITPQDQPRRVGTLNLVGLAKTSLTEKSGIQVTEIIPLCRAENRAENIVVIAGEGGMGSDGFVAVTDLKDRLCWVAFFDFSNPFVSVRVEATEIIAENNLGERWCFSKLSPSRIKVEAPPAV